MIDWGIFSEQTNKKCLFEMRAYRTDWAEFALHYNKCNEASLPASANTVVAFIGHLTELGISSASNIRKFVSIAAVHRWAECADPTKSSVTKLALRKMHRKLGRICKQAELSIRPYT